MIYSHYDCRTCTAALQVERGCTEDAPIPYWSDLQGIQRSECPRRPLFKSSVWFNEIIAAYNAYMKGFLPHAGGMVDQAANFSQLMSIVDSAVNTCQKELDRRERGGNMSGGGGGQSLLRRK